jgi:ABC-type multidrug transport system permease subunit
MSRDKVQQIVLLTAGFAIMGALFFGAYFGSAFVILNPHQNVPEQQYELFDLIWYVGWGIFALGYIASLARVLRKKD